jgi:hypothetical protein
LFCSDGQKDAGVADAEAEECGTKTDGMLSSTKPSMEGLYPVLIVMCVHYFHRVTGTPNPSGI